MEHGCGDKWGLFASYIPHRVGYQCSAAYRHIIIPRVRCFSLLLFSFRQRQPRFPLFCNSRRGAQGLLRDNHFLMTSGGEAVWAGGRGGRKAAEDN